MPSYTTRLPRPTSILSIVFSPRPATASNGDAIGWTWCASPNPTGTSTTCTGRTRGVIATTSSRASTTTSRYDAFVKEQLAGDEMDPADRTYLVASGFNRLGPLRKNAGNQDVASSHNEVLTEMTNIVGAAFLGVTVGCARCHDHKFDPFRQSDYYRLQAHFAQVAARRSGAGQPGRSRTPGRPRPSRWNSRNGASRPSCSGARPTPPRPSWKPDLEALDDQCRLRSNAIYSVKDDPQQGYPGPRFCSTAII